MTLSASQRSAAVAHLRYARELGIFDFYQRPFDAAQKEWHIVGHGLSIKRYPICYATHRSIDAALDLVMRHDLTPGKVERIHVSTGKTQMLMLRNSRPQTGLEAKFSMQFAIAAALCARNVGLRELTDDFVRRPEVQAIFPRVSLEGTAATELVPELGVETTDYVSPRRHGVAPFTGTPLHATLQALGVRVLVVTGVSVNIAVLGLCIEAVNLGYQVVVASDAVTGVPLDYADLVMANSVALVASVRTVDEIIGALAALAQ